MTHVHLVGIGGAGLSAIARVLLEKGETVSGSDRTLSAMAQALREAGARVFIGHNAGNITGADYLVRSSAIPDDNVEVQAALSIGIPVFKRAEFLPTLMRDLSVIAVAGTHGKTTTTGMIAWMLTELGLDPSFIVGSTVANLERNARAGKGAIFVIEADEYDRMFLGLEPTIAVVTNIEHDHPDCFPSEAEFRKAFLKFAQQLRPEGILLTCSDDQGARWLHTQMETSGTHNLTYGLNHWLGHSGPDYYCRGLQANQLGGFDFEFVSPRTFVQDDSASIKVELQVPGRHNVINATATLAVADLLHLPLDQAARALSKFRGTARRFEIRGEAKQVIVIDDYAHHPTEIRATLAAARARFPNLEIWALWQPHTYSRTRALYTDFTQAFVDADHVVVLDVYAAREALPSDGFTSREIAHAILHDDVQYRPELFQSPGWLLERLKPGSVLLVLSAGDADQLSSRVLADLRMQVKNEIFSGEN
ncbi:MAG TPA: UDP-N-acetylmuramate--L-alanine ligase [Anaerolineales bacterium]|nr:UDP-N-acetylmuramate--L-alanine ligase [Anaerolineales bacterium]